MERSIVELSFGSAFLYVFLLALTKYVLITHLLQDSDMRFQVYIRDSLFRYVSSKFKSRLGG